MATTSLKAQTRARDYAFAAWLLFVCGFLLLEVGWMGSRRMLAARLIVAVACGAAAALALGRYRMHAAALEQSRDASSGERSVQGRLACVVLVAALGYLLGKAVLVGFFTPTVIVSTCVLFMPWSKLSFHRRHVPGTTVVFCTAAALVLFTAIRPAGSILFALAGWVACVTGAVAIAVEAIERSRIGPTEEQTPQHAAADLPATH